MNKTIVYKITRSNKLISLSFILFPVGLFLLSPGYKVANALCLIFFLLFVHDSLKKLTTKIILSNSSIIYSNLFETKKINLQEVRNIIISNKTKLISPTTDIQFSYLNKKEEIIGYFDDKGQIVDFFKKLRNNGSY